MFSRHRGGVVVRGWIPRLHAQGLKGQIELNANTDVTHPEPQVLVIANGKRRFKLRAEASQVAKQWHVALQSCIAQLSGESLVAKGLAAIMNQMSTGVGGASAGAGAAARSRSGSGGGSGGRVVKRSSGGKCLVFPLLTSDLPSFSL
jgi:hypothetical protein